VRGIDPLSVPEEEKLTFYVRPGDPSILEEIPPEGTESVSQEINRLSGAPLSYSGAVSGRRRDGDVEAQSNGERKPLLRKNVKRSLRVEASQMRRSTTNESVSTIRLLP
jgi:hypothetical protein